MTEIYPDDLYEGLTEDEWSELDGIRTHIMRFKGIADGCATWEEIIKALQDRIVFIKELMVKGAQLIDIDNDHLFYRIPSEYSLYGIFQGVTKDYYQFLLDDGRLVTYPVEQEYDRLADAPVGTRVIVLVDAEGKPQNFIVPFNQEDKKVRWKGGQTVE